MMTRHLLWKDGMTVKPLVTAVLIGLVAIYALLALIASSMATSDFKDFFVSFWVLMPNLVALGTPALLVGSEEESGTLSWLRTLPVQWQKVADAKFLIAAAAVAITWIASSLLLYLANRTVATYDSPYADAMLSLPAIVYLLFFSFLLLICGFVTAYLFRSPVAGLIAVVPLIVIVNSVAMEVGRWMLTGESQYVGPVESIGLSGYLSVGTAGLILLATAWSLQRMLARRRLVSPFARGLQDVAAKETTSAYRPPLRASTHRPNQIAALLWQQLRQTGGFAIALTLVAGALVFSSDVRSSDVAMLSAIGASWLGGLAFYSDNVRRRCVFFADRGISPTRIWWTRLALPVACCASLVCISLVRGSDPRYEFRTDVLAVVIVVAFAFGQLIGQWMMRPVLTFFAAPAYTAVASVALLRLFELYPTYSETAILVVPVLLFATWRLSGRWLAGNVDLGYHWRAVSYTALAVAIPIVSVMGERIWTMPGEMSPWRAGLLAVQAPKPLYANGRLIHSQNIAPGAFDYGSSEKFERGTVAARRELLRQELASEGIGDYVSADDIKLILFDAALDNIEIQHDAVAVLLKWSRRIRQNVIAGENTLWDLERGERSEEDAITALENLTQIEGATEELAKLVASIPDRELRKQSRRVGLVADWQAYQAMDWKMEYPAFTVYQKNFMHHPVAYRVAWLSHERTRADRYVDQLTRLLLEQLDGALPESDSSQGFLERNRLWAELEGPSWRGNNKSEVPLTRRWTEQYEQRIDRLKKRYP